MHQRRAGTLGRDGRCSQQGARLLRGLRHAEAVHQPCDMWRDRNHSARIGEDTPVALQRYSGPPGIRLVLDDVRR